MALTAVLMLTVAAVPMAAADEAGADPMVTAGLIDDGTSDAVKWWLRVIPASGWIMGIYDYYNQDNGRVDVGAGDSDAIKAYARNVDAQRSAEQQYNLLMVASDLVRNDAQTWKLTDAYLNRAAEIAAGTVWYEGAVFDADGILDYGGVYAAVSTGNLNTQDVLDRAITVSVDLRDEWDATNYGGTLQIQLIWDGGSTGNATTTLHADFCTLATVSGTNNVVYLSQTAADASTAENSTIWAYSGAGTITPIAPGSTAVSLTKGANDVSSLPSGFYVLSPGTYGGPFMSSVSEIAAPVKGVMGIVCDDNYGYASSSGDEIEIFWDGTTIESTTLDYQITGCDEPQNSHGSPAALVCSYGEYYDQLTALLFEAAESAQVMWTISASTHTSNLLLSPSSLIPHLRNVGVDAEQSYAMYVMALDQLGQYNSAYGGVLKDGMTKISAQSLDLYCHGSIYAADGTAIAENVIFTPYVYLKDWTIYSGQNNTFGQDGMVMVWDAADTAAGWTVSSTAGNYQSIVVQKGAYILPDEVIYRGLEVPSLHLDVEEVQRISAFAELDWDRADAPKVLSASTLIMMIVVELGAIIALIGYIVRMPALIVIGLIVAVIGAVASDWIARVALGNEDPWGWLPWRF
ncbi:MAG: hypothetical protein RBR26_06785 [Methanosarcina mazei]|nr:hypothetical protein [Methanosarcina mazei]